MTVRRVHRSVRLLRRAGDSPPTLQEWGCRIDVLPEGLDVAIQAPRGLAGADLDALMASLHAALRRRLPPALGAGLTAEVGVVRTEAWEDVRPIHDIERGYALALCADAVLMLSGDVRAAAPAPSLGVCSVADIAPQHTVALGPSAVLALVAGALELGEPSPELPSWISVEATRRSPYPPQDDPCEALRLPESAGMEDLAAAVAWWGAHTERWLRPMWTTRARRGQYRVRTSLPAAAAPAAVLRIDSLVSLDTRGRSWQASLSIGQDGVRRCIATPVRLEVPAGGLLHAARAEAEPPQPALDRDPIDGRSFGWAPCLLTGVTAAELDLPPG